MSKYATKEQLISIVQDMASKISVPTIGIGGGYAPIGTVISYMGVTAPQDYLACDGSTYNISAYPDLADFFESQFGSKNYFGGDGTTTFAVPDLRGEFLRGTGTNSHTNQGSGANVGVHQNATQFPHIEIYNNQLLFKVQDTKNGAFNNTDSKVYNQTYACGAKTESSGAETNQYTYASARPTNTSILWCIKAVATGAGILFDETGTERIVGEYKLANGTKKPVYEKHLVLLNQTNINNTTVDIAENVDILISKEITGIRTVDSAKNPVYIPYVSNNTTNYDNFLLSGFFKDLNGNNNKLIWQWQLGATQDGRIHDFYITVRYTKITDTPS